jgi:hypothetical protein
MNMLITFMNTVNNPKPMQMPIRINLNISEYSSIIIKDTLKTAKYPKIKIIDRDAATAEDIAEKAAKLSTAILSKLCLGCSVVFTTRAPSLALERPSWPSFATFRPPRVAANHAWQFSSFQRVASTGTHATFEHVAYAEFTTDRFRVDRLALVEDAHTGQLWRTLQQYQMVVKSPPWSQCAFQLLGAAAAQRQHRARVLKAALSAAQCDADRGTAVTHRCCVTAANRLAAEARGWPSNMKRPRARKPPAGFRRRVGGAMPKTVTWRAPRPRWRRNPPVGFIRPWRAYAHRPPAVQVRCIAQRLEQIDQQIVTVEAAILGIVGADASLSDCFAILISIPGLSNISTLSAAIPP